MSTQFVPNDRNRRPLRGEGEKAPLKTTELVLPVHLASACRSASRSGIGSSTGHRTCSPCCVCMRCLPVLASHLAEADGDSFPLQRNLIDERIDPSA